MPVKKIKLPDSSVIDINDSRIHIYRTLTGTAADTVSPYSHAKWDVTDSTITEYFDGMVVCLKVPIAGNGTYGTGFQINNLGYKPVVYNVNSMVSTRYGVGSVIWCVYNATQTGSLYINSTAAVTVTGCWQVQDYDSNTNTIGYQLRTNSSTRPVSSATYRYRLMFSSLDNSKWVPANNSTSTNATSARTVNQEVINPWGRIVYYSTTSARAAGQNISVTAQWDRYIFDLGYSFNTGSALDLTFPGPVYIKCTPQDSGGAIIDSTTPYTQSLPSSADGKIYIYLGQAYSASEVELIDYHPVLYHDGTKIALWTDTKVFSGDYNDLTNKPPIPDEVSGVNDGTNWTSITIGTKTYSIPSGGGVQALTSPIRIWDLNPGVYILPSPCTVYYSGSSNTSSSATIYGGILQVFSTSSDTIRKWKVTTDLSEDTNPVYPNRFYWGATTSSSGNISSVSYLTSQRPACNSGTSDYSISFNNIGSNLARNSYSVLSNGVVTGKISSSTTSIPVALTTDLSAETAVVMTVINPSDYNVAGNYVGRQDLYVTELNRHFYRFFNFTNSGITSIVTNTTGADANGWVEVFERLPSIDELNETNISSPTNGQILKYNSTTSKWENGDMPTEVLKCNLNISLNDPSDYNSGLLYTCDKTDAEIYAAYQAGKCVILETTGSDFSMDIQNAPTTKDIYYLNYANVSQVENTDAYQFIFSQGTYPLAETLKIAGLSQSLLGYSSFLIQRHITRISENITIFGNYPISAGWYYQDNTFAVPANTTSGHLASLTSSGEYSDSGISATDVSTAVTNSHTHSNKTVLDYVPASLGTAGQVLKVNSGATGLEFGTVSGGLTNYDFTHTANATISGSTTTVTFAANTRGSAMLTISADLGLTIACNNGSDNYIWVKNTSSSEVDVTISGVTKNSTNVSNVYVPSDGISVPAGGLCEIGIIVNTDGAFITSRNDLAL